MSSDISLCNQVADLKECLNCKRNPRLTAPNEQQSWMYPHTMKEWNFIGYSNTTCYSYLEQDNEIN